MLTQLYNSGIKMYYLLKGELRYGQPSFQAVCS